MVVLDRFLTQCPAVFGVQGEGVVIGFFGAVVVEGVGLTERSERLGRVGAGLLDEGFEVFEEALVALWAFAVGAPEGFHLEEAEIESHLHLGFAVVAADESDVDLAGLVGPVPEDAA